MGWDLRVSTDDGRILERSHDYRTSLCWWTRPPSGLLTSLRTPTYSSRRSQLGDREYIFGCQTFPRETNVTYTSLGILVGSNLFLSPVTRPKGATTTTTKDTNESWPLTVLRVERSVTESQERSADKPIIPLLILMCDKRETVPTRLG